MTIPDAFEVYAQWPQHATHPSNAPFTVHHAGGSTTVYADQQVNGGQWNLLGTFVLQRQYFDQESSFHYNYFRDYDPSTGRYVQSDPIGLSGGINLYEYAESNTLRFSDSSGLAIWICNRKVLGPPFVGNHAYLWDDRNGGASCGMQSSFGQGPRGQNEAGPSVDSCKKIPGTDSIEDKIMNCCRNNANNGLWVPGINDCHNAANDCVASAGIISPGAPGGRVGPRCDTCPKAPPTKPNDVCKFGCNAL